MEDKLLIEYDSKEKAEQVYKKFMEKFSNHLSDKEKEEKRKQIGKNVIITNIKHGSNLSSELSSSDVLEGAVNVRVEKNLGDLVVLSEYSLSGTALIVEGSEEEQTMLDFLVENGFTEITSVDNKKDLFY